MDGFIVIGNMNAVTYKEIFPLIKDNKMWLGQNAKGGSRKGNSLSFEYPNGEFKDVSSWWYTNIDVKKDKPLVLTKSYYKNPELYPKYDNYDAIEVSRSEKVPIDYDGVMGVPISFLMFHNPSQFEIIDARDIALNDKQKNKKTSLIKDADSAINGKPTYARICIKKKDELIPVQFEIIGWSRHNDLNMDGGYWLGGKIDATINGKIVYRRILIRKK